MKTAKAKTREGLVRKVVVRLPIPESMVPDKYNDNLDTLFSGKPSPQSLVDGLSKTSLRVQADMELFRVQVEAACEAAKDEGAVDVKIEQDGGYTHQEAIVVGWYPMEALTAEAKATKIQGVRAGLLRRAKSLAINAAIDLEEKVENMLLDAFTDYELGKAGLKKKEEYDKLVAAVKAQLVKNMGHNDFT